MNFNAIIEYFRCAFLQTMKDETKHNSRSAETEQTFFNLQQSIVYVFFVPANVF